MKHLNRPKEDELAIPGSSFKYFLDPIAEAHVWTAFDFAISPLTPWSERPVVKPEVTPGKHRTVSIELFGSRIAKMQEKIEEPINRAILDRGSALLPQSLSDAFALYLNRRLLTTDTSRLLEKFSLLPCYYGDYAIVTRGDRPWQFYTQTIDFFSRFGHLVVSEHGQGYAEHHPFLLYQVPSDAAANATYLLFYYTYDRQRADETLDSVKHGVGMLIKSLSDPEYGGAVDREIEVILLGSFLRADVPMNGVIIKGGSDAIIDQFGKKAPLFIETLTPDCKPLNAATDYDMKRVAKENPEVLGRMLVFDTVAGAWDRHQGNYLLHTLPNNTRSIQEIDFGLFDPLWIKPGNYTGRLDEWINSRYSSFSPEDKPGWDITRHPKVTDMIKQAEPERVKAGIQQAMYYVQFGFREGFFRTNLSEKFCKRIEVFLDPNSELRFGFQMDLASLGLHD